MSDASEGASGAEPLHERPADLLSDLIRFDTTNPPGDERECVEWIADRLAEYGIDSETYALTPDRPNLLARLPGGDAPALLLYGHVDVVPTTGQDWTHPPFDGVVEDGYVWGRGALDMKGGVSMMLAAFLRAAAEDLDLAGNLLFCVVSDEEVVATTVPRISSRSTPNSSRTSSMPSASSGALRPRSRASVSTRSR